MSLGPVIFRHLHNLYYAVEISLISISLANKHPMGCEAQLAWKCLFMPTFSTGNSDP